MEIIFREMPHTYDEVVMGHKLWFPESIESDVISATANIDGFTPLTAISRKYGCRNDLLTAASAQCNIRNEIAVIKELMEHADKYGIVLSKDDVYPEPIVTTVKVDRPITDLASWSINNGTSYKDVKLLNPWILKRALPAPKNGAYYIDIPNKR